jgi:hypothetical protein
LENKKVKEEEKEYDDYLRDIYEANEKPEAKGAKEIAVIFEDQDDFLGLAKLCCWEIRVRMRTQQKEPSDEEYNAAMEEYNKSIENAFGDIDK